MLAGDLTVTRPPVYAAGYRNVSSTRHDIHRVVEGFRTRTVDPLTCVLMLAGDLPYRRPVYAVGIVMFLPTRHDIHRVVEGFRTRTVDPLTCVLMLAGRFTVPSARICGGVS
ncbi:hypothetical protein TNCT_16381 [Trichonephila clavata]|uniref:Uncharacterized protein n=1 Tax=Trichonephila clavata TaxID=2740835 RepID=A0A8X6IN54_TRICU|nr:hypothetical protein TNCT_16381 [Trichonephila clavata]